MPTVTFVLLLTVLTLRSGATNAAPARLQLSIDGMAPDGRIAVNVHNSSKVPLRLWNESNSWGSARWRVLAVRDGAVNTFYQKPDQRFTRNMPTYTEISPGASVKHVLDVNGIGWVSATGSRLSIRKGDLVIAIYDAPKQYGWVGAPITVQASKMGVWYGVATCEKIF